MITYLIAGKVPDKRVASGNRTHSIYIMLPDYMITEEHLNLRFPWWESISVLNPPILTRKTPNTNNYEKRKL